MAEESVPRNFTRSSENQPSLGLDGFHEDERVRWRLDLHNSPPVSDDGCTLDIDAHGEISVPGTKPLPRNHTSIWRMRLDRGVLRSSVFIGVCTEAYDKWNTYPFMEQNCWGWDSYGKCIADGSVFTPPDNAYPPPLVPGVVLECVLDPENGSLGIRLDGLEVTPFPCVDHLPRSVSLFPLLGFYGWNKPATITAMPTLVQQVLVLTVHGLRNSLQELTTTCTTAAGSATYEARVDPMTKLSVLRADILAYLQVPCRVALVLEDGQLLESQHDEMMLQTLFNLDDSF
jgi:hypothetical protein